MIMEDATVRKPSTNYKMEDLITKVRKRNENIMKIIKSI